LKPVQFPAGAEMFLFLSVSRPALDPISAFYLMGKRVSILRGKVTLTSSGAEIINAWSYNV